jgi:hypothetical protein
MSRAWKSEEGEEQLPYAKKIFKVTDDDADTHCRECHATEKANSTER